MLVVALAAVGESPPDSGLLMVFAWWFAYSLILFAFNVDTVYVIAEALSFFFAAAGFYLASCQAAVASPALDLFAWVFQLPIDVINRIPTVPILSDAARAFFQARKARQINAMVYGHVLKVIFSENVLAAFHRKVAWMLTYGLGFAFWNMYYATLTMLAMISHAQPPMRGVCSVLAS